MMLNLVGDGMGSEQSGSVFNESKAGFCLYYGQKNTFLANTGSAIKLPSSSRHSFRD